jgi:Protein of unknown function (DUF4054)
MIEVCAFRAAFPEFEDTAKYPDAQICFWGEVAEKQVVARRWKCQTQLGIYLYTAHEITLAGNNYQTGNNGGTPGGQSGPMNSKTVGSVTAAYDTQQGMEKDAGWWNLTSYGKQFIRLSRIFGSGGLQLI